MELSNFSPFPLTSNQRLSLVSPSIRIHHWSSRLEENSQISLAVILDRLIVSSRKQTDPWNKRRSSTVCALDQCLTILIPGPSTTHLTTRHALKMPTTKRAIPTARGKSHQRHRNPFAVSYRYESIIAVRTSPVSRKTWQQHDGSHTYCARSWLHRINASRQLESFPA